jgi:hypothetical protein
MRSRDWQEDVIRPRRRWETVRMSDGVWVETSASPALGKHRAALALETRDRIGFHGILDWIDGLARPGFQ